MISECKATSYCFNPLELARTVEIVSGKYLKPMDVVPGLYIGDSIIPSVKFDGKSYSMVNTPNGVIKVAIYSIGDVLGDIYDENNKRIYAYNSNKYISDIPDTPIRGLAIIDSYVDKIILDNSIWVDRNKQDIDEIWKPFILPEYADNYQVYESIEKIIYEVYERLIHFIGPNKWIIHFKSKPFRCGESHDILIEKYGDYRIDAWMREHGDEYKTKL